MDAIKKNKAVKSVLIYTTLPQRYGHMIGIPKYERLGRVRVFRFYTPEHNNSFIGQFISYCFFGKSVLIHAYLNRKNFDSIFATSSRLGTGFLGYLVSKITRKNLSLDMRDIFSDNLQSLKFFKGFIGRTLIKLFRNIEKRIIYYANWVNFVSPGFFSYPHIKILGKKIHLFTNGIDEVFLIDRKSNSKKVYTKFQDRAITITYAGNIGYGQGLELIVLPLAANYKDKIFIQLIGDGSSVNLIKKGIANKRLDNIQLIAPVKRSKLLEYYNDTDMFLLQLNDIPAFTKVLPSKIFEYGSFNKPILAGVRGVAKSFLEENLNGVHLFNPGDVNSVVEYVDSIIKSGLPSINNEDFIKKYSRKNIMDDMLNSIIFYYNEKS